MKKNVLIIGYGVVGINMNKIFPDADIYDPKKHALVEPDTTYKVGFICVPTDLKGNGMLDTSIVSEAIETWNKRCDVLCIRSTVPIGFTDGELNCVFQPEYYGATKHANAKTFNFIILGGRTCFTNIVAEVYKEVSSADMKIIKTSSITAELVKFMENSWLATKVTFCCEFFKVAEELGVDYDELRELFLLDPRVNPSHTFVYREHPFYDSHCLNKDIPHIINQMEKRGVRMYLLEAVRTTNMSFVLDHDCKTFDEESKRNGSSVIKPDETEPDGMC